MKIRTPKRPKAVGCPRRGAVKQLVALLMNDIRSSRGRKAARDHVSSCRRCGEAMAAWRAMPSAATPGGR